MKKILFIINVDWFFVSHRLPIALEAIKLGYDVHLACTFIDDRSNLEKLGITCHDINFSRNGGSVFSELLSIIKLRKIIINVRPDLVHSVTIKPVIYAGMAMSFIPKSPSFVAAISGLGYVFSASSFRAKLTKLCVSFLYKISLHKNNKIVVFQNISDETVLSKIVKLTEKNKVLIKGSGADLSIYKFSSPPPAKKIIISMACRLLKEKGVYQFVEAARIIRNKKLNTEFQLIGEVDLGNPNSVSQVEINSWVNEGVISALGHRDDIPDLFEKSHIVTLPSYYGEGVPKVLIEAASCGRPIVTTDNPGCRDAVIVGETGLLVPIKDSLSLSQALETLIKDENMRNKMGDLARKYAISEFDINQVVTKHIEIYESLMAGYR